MKKILLITFTISTFYLSILLLSNKKENNKLSIKTEHYLNSSKIKTNDVIELRCSPIDTVRIGFIGIGNRGTSAVIRYTHIENTKIIALCDVNKKNIEKCLNKLKKTSSIEPDIYLGKEDWKKLCERSDIDLIYVATHWDLHAEIAVYAMEHGKHVAVEVPAALTIDECWKLVNTAEKTKKHCFQLENCIYDNFELSCLNMTQKGLFGEVVHCEGAYIHDLRASNFGDTYWNKWRLKHMIENDGNTYPTHALGPISHILNIHRGDKMNYLVSMSSNEFGMTDYVKNNFDKKSEYSNQKYKKGDINTSIIKTTKGKTIILQHNTSNPRPYSRLYTINGTKGFAQKYPIGGIAINPDPHHFLSKSMLEKLLKQYEHPIVKEIKQKALKIGGHGGMDFIMDYRLIYCLRNGLPLDQDVYDAAEWSSIIELSKKSVNNNSKPIKIPDFTRGAWKKITKVTYYKN
jgi:predicted dehydrogenase